MNPKKTRRRLMRILRRKKAMTFEEIAKFNRQPDVYFGPGVDAFDVLLANRDLGRCTFDWENQEVKSE